MQPANRLIYNTGIIYTRLLISLVIGLFTTRIILNTLGETDYGIYALVAGVIGMLSFINSSLSIVSMRFMSHSIGSGDMERVKKTFNTTLIINFIIGIGIVLFMEIGGMLMFKYWLNIPADRIFDAKMVFHFMIIATFVAVISVPFDAVMNAHENFLAISLIDILRTVLHLGIAIIITIIETRLLLVYGFLMMLNQILQRLLKQWYSRKHYQECKIKMKDYVDKKMIREILSFAGWSVLATSGAVIITQSKSILLNMFFGVKLNAAQGVTQTLTQQLNNISVSMTQAIKPQIMKSEGSGNRTKMLYLTITTAKFSVFLFAIFAIPVFIETPYLLKLWLTNVPDFAVIFTRLIILTRILEKVTFPIITAINAIGKIKEITIVGLLFISLSIPVSYFLYKAGYPPQTIYVVGFFISICSACVRLYFGQKIAGINIRVYLKRVLGKAFFPLLLATSFTVLPYFFMEASFVRLAMTSFISLFASLLTIRYLGLTNEEYYKLREITNGFLLRIKKNRF